MSSVEDLRPVAGVLLLCVVLIQVIKQTAGLSSNGFTP